MADRSAIEWTDATWNPIRGCSRVSEGCRNCYAERTAARFAGPGQPYEGLVVLRREPGDDDLPGKGTPQWTGQVQFVEKLLDQPLRWKFPRNIFVNSMSDLFHPSVSLQWLDQIFAVMALCPRHTFQILTKRPDGMRIYLEKSDVGDRVRGAAWSMLGHYPKYNHAEIMKRPWPLPNVWLGVSVEDQKTADERIPILMETPAAVRWVSYEPALGPVDFTNLGLNTLGHNHGGKLDWIVAGGESGPDARPANPQWFRAVRDWCFWAVVPFFFKQWGEWLHLSQVPAVLTEHEMELLRFRGLRGVPESPRVEYLRLGKGRAGHLLDGKAYQEIPAGTR